jgi:hypothetical protein
VHFLFWRYVILSSRMGLMGWEETRPPFRAGCGFNESAGVEG